MVKIFEDKVDDSKNNLENLKSKLDDLIRNIETKIDNDEKLTKEIFKNLKDLVNKITTSQEKYAFNFGKK